MKILQLCHKPPYPPVDGGALGLHCITEALLTAGHSVRVLSLCSAKHPWLPQPESYVAATRFEAVDVDLTVRPLPAAVALLCGESYNVKRFYTPAFDARLAAVLDEEEFDVVQFESIFMAPYLATVRAHSSAAAVVRLHNVEHHLWRRRAEEEHSPWRRWYLKHLALTLRAYEHELVPQFDGVSTVAPADRDYFAALCPRRPVVDVPPMVRVHLPSVEPMPATFYHLGAMDWQPNVAAVHRLAEKIWPDVRRRCPDARLFLAGRQMPADLMALRVDGVTVQGEVPSAEAFIADKAVNVVPLSNGSGIRIKIMEAMAAGKAVVGSPTALAGMAGEAGRTWLQAESDADFVDAMLRLAHDPAEVQRLGRAAAETVAARYSPEVVSQLLVSLYDEAIAGRARRQTQ